MILASSNKSPNEEQSMHETLIVQKYPSGRHWSPSTSNLVYNISSISTINGHNNNIGQQLIIWWSVDATWLSRNDKRGLFVASDFLSHNIDRWSSFSPSLCPPVFRLLLWVVAGWSARNLTIQYVALSNEYSVWNYCYVDFRLLFMILFFWLAFNAWE